MQKFIIPALTWLLMTINISNGLQSCWLLAPISQWWPSTIDIWNPLYEFKDSVWIGKGESLSIDFLNNIWSLWIFPFIHSNKKWTHLVIWLTWCMSPLLNHCQTYSKEAGGRQDNCSLDTSRENSLALIFFSFSKGSRGEVIKRIPSSLFLSLIRPTTLLVPGCPMWLICLA